MHAEEWDLVIVGCGPVGEVAGNLAGQAGLRTLVIDRAATIAQQPRAIHFDSQIMRIYQSLGLADIIGDLSRVWRRSVQSGADRLPNITYQWPDDLGDGWHAHYLFHQPELEHALREGMTRFPSVTVKLDTDLVALEQNDNHVTLTVRDGKTGAEQNLRSQYVIGADGASSRVRRELGIRLLDDGFDQPWLVVDIRGDQSFGPEDESEQICDPTRPTTRVPGPRNYHRWEFMILPGEDPTEFEKPAMVEALLSPWVEIGQVEVLRASVYRFHALHAETWRSGRVFLAGDAAHQTPPFLGQGLCHGIRDVHNLIWKLRWAHNATGNDPELLLDTYELERRPQVAAIVQMAVEQGRTVCMTDRDRARSRDARLRALASNGLIPNTTWNGLPPLSAGLLSDSPGAGELFPQPFVTTAHGQRRLDDMMHTELAVIALGESAGSLQANAVHPEAQLIDISAQVSANHHLSAWRDRTGAAYVVLRPDRYVYGTANTLVEAAQLLRELAAYR